jgi:hypothetical protein
MIFPYYLSSVLVLGSLIGHVFVSIPVLLLNYVTSWLAGDLIFYYYYGSIALCWALAAFPFLDPIHSR